MTIRKQLMIAFLISLLVTTIIFGFAYNRMFVASNVFWMMLLATVLSSGLALLLIMVLMSPVIKKINQLNQETRNIADGQMDQKVTVLKAPKELRELSISIDTMTSAIIGQLEQIKLEQQQKNDLLQNLAHDLKTPLAGIVSHAQGLSDGLINTDDKKLEAYKILKNQSMRLSGLFDQLNDVVSLSKRQVHLENVHLDRLLVGLLETYEPTLKQQHRGIQVDFPETLPVMTQDRLALERILTNLIDNAIKFSDVDIKLAVQQTDTQVTISVQDYGAGIAPEHLTYVFDRTYRVENSRSLATGGSGLGLFIAKSLANSIGAKLRLDSVVGQGTTATIVINL